MIELIPVTRHVTLDDYAALVFLTEAVRGLRLEANELVPRLRGRVVWMCSSTARGGGVAEMMPALVGTLREIGVKCEWAVMAPSRPEFFELTRRLHDMIHGRGDPALDAADRELYDAVSGETAAELGPRLAPGDLLVVHDPQPLGVGALIAEKRGITAIFRSHIGLDEHTPATDAAWHFLEPYAQAYSHAIFSAAAYAPSYLAARVSIVPPSIDPLDHKSRALSPHKLMGILCNSRLVENRAPVLTPAFERPARRLTSDGTLAPADEVGDLELLYRPIVTQVSRWDHLKGFVPLLDAFVRLKQRSGSVLDERARRRLEILRLVLVGPEPDSIADDPAGVAAFREVVARYAELDPALQRDVAVLVLPLESVKQNALMVNAIQHCSTVIAQNSLREGFGLTATEAMWKGVPVLASSAHGLKLQVRDGLDGRIIKDPEDAEEIASTLEVMLADTVAREKWGRNAQRRVLDEFLVQKQVSRLLRILAECADLGANGAPRG